MKILHTVFSTLILSIIVITYGPSTQAKSIGTAFTYQGRLLDEQTAAEGLYDFRFQLFDSVIDGNQVDGDLFVSDINVNDGFFTVKLDFGSEAFNGDTRWLQIAVRPGYSTSSSLFEVLYPRQEITPVPYALWSEKCGTIEYVKSGGTSEIQAAIDRLADANGGIVQLSATTYICEPDTEIILKSGVHIRGVVPKLGPDVTVTTTRYIIDTALDLHGGTIFTQSGEPSVAVFGGNDIYGASIENVGFKDVWAAMDFGEADEFGMLGCQIRNVFIDECASYGIRLYNMERVRMDHCMIQNNKMSETTWYGYHFISENDEQGVNHMQPGNCVFTDLFAGIGFSDTKARTVRGFFIESKTYNGDGSQFNYMTFIRPQSNLFGFKGTEAGSNRRNFYVEGDVDAKVFGLSVIDGDFEGVNEYHVYIGEYVQHSKIGIKGFSSQAHAATNVYLDKTSQDIEVQMASHYSLIDKGNYNRVVTAPAGNGVVTDLYSSPRSAATMLVTYRPNSTIFISYNGAKSYELPLSSDYLKGMHYTFIKTSSAAEAVTVYGEEIWDVPSDNVVWNDGRCYIDTGDLPEWPATVNEYKNFKVYLENTGSDPSGDHVVEGWYACTSSTSNTLEFFNANCTDDAGASSPYQVNWKLRCPIYDSDGTIDHENTDIDSQGDTTTFVSSGGKAGNIGWFITNKEINP